MQPKRIAKNRKTKSRIKSDLASQSRSKTSFPTYVHCSLYVSPNLFKHHPLDGGQPPISRLWRRLLPYISMGCDVTVRNVYIAKRLTRASAADRHFCWITLRCMCNAKSRIASGQMILIHWKWKSIHQLMTASATAGSNVYDKKRRAIMCLHACVCVRARTRASLGLHFMFAGAMTFCMTSEWCCRLVWSGSTRTLCSFRMTLESSALANVFDESRCQQRCSLLQTSADCHTVCLAVTSYSI